MENEIKFKSLKEAIEIERKKSEEYDNAKKELQEKNDDLEKMLRKEIKELNVKIVNQQKVIEEMLSKENMNYIKDTDEDVPNIVVKELKGRNVTIIKTKTGNNPPKTPAVIATVEENILVENVNKQSEERTAQDAVDRTEYPKQSENEKVKPKRTKITKTSWG